MTWWWWCQSGAHNLLLPVSAADRATERVMEHLGHPSAEVLRSLPAEELLAAQGAVTPRSAGVFYGPLRDSDVLPIDAVGALRAGSAAGISVLVGSNRDEMGFFRGRDERLDTMDDATVAGLVGGLTKPRTEEVLLEYCAARAARGETVDNRSVAMAVGADGTFRNGVLEMADIQGTSAVCYAYLVDWESPLFDGLVGACHLLEMPFVTGKTSHPALAGFVGGPSDAAERLSGQMMDAWVGFARSGNPGWAAYDPATRPTMRFGRNSRLEQDPWGAERQAWAGTAGQDPRRGG